MKCNVNIGEVNIASINRYNHSCVVVFDSRTDPKKDLGHQVTWSIFLFKYCYFNYLVLISSSWTDFS